MISVISFLFSFFFFSTIPIFKITYTVLGCFVLGTQCSIMQLHIDCELVLARDDIYEL